MTWKQPLPELPHVLYYGTKRAAHIEAITGHGLMKEH